MKFIRPESKPFVFTVRDEDGTLLGLAPLCRMRFQEWGFSLKAVGFAGREVVSGDFLDFLSSPEIRSQALNTILRALWDRRSVWSLLVLGELTLGSDLHAVVKSWAQEKGLMIRQQEERNCPYIELPRTFDEYLCQLGTSMRYHIRRRQRDLLEKHGAHIEVYSEPEEIRSGLDILIKLHLARWRHVNNPGTFKRPGFAKFIREICTAPPAGSRPRLYLLKYEGRAIAALLAFHFGQSALYYQAGWDPDSFLVRFSPGVVLMAQSIRDAIDCGLRYYEFLRGDEFYKSHWTNTVRQTATLLFARTTPARAYLGASDLKDGFKRLLPGTATSGAAA